MIIRAAAPSDRGALQNFPATHVQPPPRAHQAGYPGWWEKDAEAVIRSLRPSLPPHRRALVGGDGSVLVVQTDVFADNVPSRALLASRGVVELPVDDDGWITALRG